MVSSRAGRIVILGVVLLVAAAGPALILGRGCRAEPQPPATIAPPSATPAAPSSTPVRISPTSPPTAAISPSVTFAPPTATSMPETVTATPTARISPTVTVAPTAELLGRHTVKRGETMYGIALEWAPGRFFLWAEDVWRPVCAANPGIGDCRMIYPGDVLNIPKR